MPAHLAVLLPPWTGASATDPAPFPEPLTSLTMLVVGVAVVLVRHEIADVLTSRRGRGPRWRRLAVWECVLGGTVCAIDGLVHFVQWVV
jgi:hypothetical protein